MKFVKRAVVIDAIQYLEESDIERMSKEWGENFDNACIFDDVSDRVVALSTLEGAYVLKKNDWVIRGIEGEFYPCKPSIFAKSYFEAGQLVDLNNEIARIHKEIAHQMEELKKPLMTVVAK